MHTIGRAALLGAVIVGSSLCEAAAQVMGPMNSAPPWTARQRPKPDGSTEERYAQPTTPQGERPVMGAQPNEPPKRQPAPGK
jgi:hypothetical protein